MKTRTLQEIASDIVSDNFGKWYQQELAGKGFDYSGSLSKSDIEELCALRWKECKDFENTEVLTESRYSKEIVSLSVRCAQGDLDAIYELPRIIQLACISYYSDDIEDLLSELYMEQKERQNLTMSSYDRGMYESGHRESDFR